MQAGCARGLSQVINQDFGGEADVHTTALEVRIGILAMFTITRWQAAARLNLAGENEQTWSGYL